MTKIVALRWLNVVLFVAVTAQFALLFTMQNAGWFYGVHEWLGYGIGAIVLVHLWLNWSWIKNSYFARKKAES